MTHHTKQTLLMYCFLAVCFVAETGSIVHANERRLILPDQASENVELVLQVEWTHSDASNILQVFVGKPEACCDHKSPVAGTYRVDGRTVTFDPTFDFVSGQSYTVRSHHRDSGEKSVLDLTEFTIPLDSDHPHPEVIAVYPSGADVPENTLRFYVHFATPMATHRSSEFIKLIDADGMSDPDAFMFLKQELWNAERTRLTLLMDPGRIKRGVAQNLTSGPALIAGSRYSIVIEPGWPSASGKKEAPRFEQSFMATRALRTLPDTKLWQFFRPRAATHDPLVIAFDRAFDFHLAQSSITVLDEYGQRVPGAVFIEAHQKTWRFQPDQIWANSLVRLVVDARLEDVAGNNFRDLLDHAVGSGVTSVDHRVVTLKLKPKSDWQDDVWMHDAKRSRSAWANDRFLFKSAIK